jgi:AcrR family transcriptional regulator
VQEPLRKGERRRRAIVDAAIVRFSSQGYRTTTLSAIAADAGVTPAAVYRYFADKDELFAAAVDADAGELVALARSSLEANATDSLGALLGDLAEGLAAAVDRHPLVGRVLAGLDPLPPERILELPALANLRDYLVELISFGQQAGLVRASLDPRNTVVALETVVLDHVAGLVALGRPHGAADARWSAVVELLDVALRPEAS